MKKIAVCYLAFIILSGCEKQIPEPKAVQAEEIGKSYEASSKLTIRHMVQGNNLLVECIIPELSFNSKSNVKIKLYVNGNEFAEYETAAFIVKNLKPGKQDIEVEIINPDNQSIRLYDKFSVIIS